MDARWAAVGIAVLAATAWWLGRRWADRTVGLATAHLEEPPPADPGHLLAWLGEDA